MKIFYGNFDGQASRYDGMREAWVLSEDRSSWKEINSASHDNAAQPLTKEEFEAKFPDAPPLPPEAFNQYEPIPPEIIKQFGYED